MEGLAMERGKGSFAASRGIRLAQRFAIHDAAVKRRID
jgi:hypothetical protein